jgi:hypothetical protein
MNCKPGDIAIITWDEEPVFSNIGKLVLVEGPLTYCIEYGQSWYVTPVNYGDGYLFIDMLKNGAVVKLWHPWENGLIHPDGWMRPLENPDEVQLAKVQQVKSNALPANAEEHVEADTADMDV